MEIITSWTDSGIDWDNPDITNIKCLQALWLALNERLLVLRNPQTSISISSTIPIIDNITGEINLNGITNIYVGRPSLHNSFLYNTDINYPTVLNSYLIIQKYLQILFNIHTVGFSITQSLYLNKDQDWLDDYSWYDDIYLKNIGKSNLDPNLLYPYRLTYPKALTQAGYITGTLLNKNSSIDDCKEWVIQAYKTLNEIQYLYLPNPNRWLVAKRTSANNNVDSGSTTYSASDLYGLFSSYADGNGSTILIDTDIEHASISGYNGFQTGNVPGNSWQVNYMQEDFDSEIRIRTEASCLRQALYIYIANVSNTDWTVYIKHRAEDSRETTETLQTYEYPYTLYTMEGIAPQEGYSHLYKTINLPKNTFKFEQAWDLTPSVPQMFSNEENTNKRGGWLGRVLSSELIIEPAFQFHA